MGFSVGVSEACCYVWGLVRLVVICRGLVWGLVRLVVMCGV